MPAAIPFRAAPAALLLAVLAIGACDDETTDPLPPEPEIAIMRITIGGSVVDVSDAGVVTGGPISLDGSAVTATVTFLQADETPVVLVTPAEFELSAVSGAPTIFTVTPSGPFQFSFTGVTTGAAMVEFELVHTDQAHTDFGPFEIPVEVDTVQNPA